MHEKRKPRNKARGLTCCPLVQGRAETFLPHSRTLKHCPNGSYAWLSKNSLCARPNGLAYRFESGKKFGSKVRSGLDHRFEVGQPDSGLFEPFMPVWSTSCFGLPNLNSSGQFQSTLGLFRPGWQFRSTYGPYQLAWSSFVQRSSLRLGQIEVQRFGS